MRSVTKVLRRENSQAIALRIADDYDRLAEQAEAKAASPEDLMPGNGSAR